MTYWRSLLADGWRKPEILLYLMAAAVPLSFATWQALLSQTVHQQNGWLTTYDKDQVIQDDDYLAAVTAWRDTWGGWELQHASPPPDPDAYRNETGVMLSFPVFRAFTAGSPEAFERFRT